MTGRAEPSGARARLAYAAAVAGVLAAVAVIWFDRLQPVLRNVRWLWGRGGSSRLYVAAVTILFLAILVVTVHVISSRIQPVRDARIAGAAILVGWLYEWWGTTRGLWTYFTFERPPIWIVFAWPIGSLVIDRAASWAMARWESPVPSGWSERIYACCAAVIVIGIVWFSRPAWGSPITWGLVSMIVVALAFRPVPQHGLWLMTVCFVGIFWADLWGTASGCWSYYFQQPGSMPRQGLGILCGMLGNTAIVILSLRLAGAGVPELRQVVEDP